MSFIVAFFGAKIHNNFVTHLLFGNVFVINTYLKENNYPKTRFKMPEILNIRKLSYFRLSGSMRRRSR